MLLDNKTGKERPEILHWAKFKFVLFTTEKLTYIHEKS